MNKKIVMAIVAGICMLGMNAEAHCGYYRHCGGYYHRSAASAFWAGAAGGLVGAVVGNALTQTQYIAPQQVVYQQHQQVVYQQPIEYQQQQIVVQEPVIIERGGNHCSRVYRPREYVSYPVNQPTYNYSTTTVVQQPVQHKATPLIGVGVNVLGLKVGAGVGY